MDITKVILFLAVFVMLKSCSNGLPTAQPQCEVLAIPMCKGLGYNHTSFPNLLDQITQDEAAMEIVQYQPIVKANCSEYFQRYLCSLYAPSCKRDDASSPSCRFLCEESFKGCYQLMMKLGYIWPASLNCSQLHNDTQGTCIRNRSSGSVNQSNSTDDDDQNDGSGVGSGDISDPPHMQPRCERLTIPLCRRLGYNSTTVPNFFKHHSQREAAIAMSQIANLVNTGCSKYLGQFLCSLYAPKCSSNGFLPPCPSICEKARDGCHSIMSTFGYKWPAVLNCSQFQNKTERECIGSVYGGKLTSVQGMLSSPNYPEPYPADIHIKWTITLPKPYKLIQITIDTMRLEEDRNCLYDFVMIQDKMLNQVGRRLCGTYRQPYVILVRGNEASIVFVSDKNMSKTGFSLSYKGQK